MIPGHTRSLRYPAADLSSVATPSVLSYDVADPKEIVVGTFGDKFRKAREKKQLSFDDVASVTKIGSRMLQAIEAERFDQLPGGVFNKGFIRAYAKHLELNDEEAVAAYLVCLRQAQVDAQTAAEDQSPAQRPADARSKNRSGSNRALEPNKIEPNRIAQNKIEPKRIAQKSAPTAEADELAGLQLPRAEHVRPGRKDLNLNSSRGFPWAALAVAALILAIGLFYWSRHSRGTHANSIFRPPATQEIPRTESAVASPVNPATAPNDNSPAKPPLTVSPARFTSSATSSQLPLSHPASSTSVASGAPPPVAGQNTANPSKASTTSESAAPVLTLVIRATETSWISLEADGQPVGHETLIAPARTSVHASREIVAKVGNAAGIVFSLNGKEIPVEGTEGEVKTYIFDSQGMHVAPAARAQIETP